MIDSHKVTGQYFQHSAKEQIQSNGKGKPCTSIYFVRYSPTVASQLKVPWLPRNTIFFSTTNRYHSHRYQYHRIQTTRLPYFCMYTSVYIMKKENNERHLHSTYSLTESGWSFSYACEYRVYLRVNCLVETCRVPHENNCHFGYIWCVFFFVKWFWLTILYKQH